MFLAVSRSTQAPVLLWFRNDLRLTDHAALTAAAETGRPVQPVFVLDETSPDRWAPGGASRWWLHHSLAALAGDLQQHQVSLVLRRGSALQAILRLVSETGATDVYSGCPAEPWARQTDEKLRSALGRQQVGFRHFRTTTLFAPTALRAQSGGPFQVYSAFARATFAVGPPSTPLPAPRSIRALAEAPVSDRLDDWALLPSLPDWAGGLCATWTPGAAGACAQLRRFLLEALPLYAAQRDIPAENGTSMLSPHPHFGEISPAQVWHAVSASEASAGTEKLETELLWREFALHLLAHHQDMPDKPLRPSFAAVRWRHDPVGLRAWQRGRTGVPIVDAGMRQLWNTGWMHNRVRMITASFLVKHLLIRWQEGAAWFWDTLVDADLANNSMGWQWVTGSGADAAPYFRIFNPVLQARKFDPNGAYVRRWVPELAGLSASDIHAPWEAPEHARRRAGVELGRTYPKPIVDLVEGRRRALAAYAAALAGGAP
jgi:deoxyribodipyrimidine photo-lyase